MGIPIPEEYGGVGMGNLDYVLAVEEISKACASTGVTVSAHTSLCCWPILAFGTEDQKQKYLPDLATGQKLGAFGLTEPNAGTVSYLYFLRICLLAITVWISPVPPEIRVILKSR